MMEPSHSSQVKLCFKCGAEKPRTDFYKNSRMADGLLGKCKECTKKDSTERRNCKIEEVRKYDRQRAKLPHRLEDNRQRQKTGKGKEIHSKALRRQVENNPHKAVARNAVSNAIRDRRLFRKPCEICGELKSEAHHEDYSKPLDVTWLCVKHHKEIHRKYKDD